MSALTVAEPTYRVKKIAGLGHLRRTNPGMPQPSHVLLAMGYDDVAARGSLRFSLGHTSTEADVDALIAALPAVHDRALAASQVRSTFDGTVRSAS